VIEIEVQNETHQTQERIRFAAVPRIGEGLRLREPDGMWASYDVLDVWYQKADFGDVWIPYLHVCLTPEEGLGPEDAANDSDVIDEDDAHDLSGEDAFAALDGEAKPFKI
jgi:hypothetical protein